MTDRDPPISPDDLAQLLRAVRKRQRVTAKRLAELVGVEVHSVFLWEKGKSLHRTARVLNAFEQLGCTVKIILPQEPPPNPADLISNDPVGSRGRVR